MIKRIGVITSGGDAPGMNAAVRAVVRSAIASGLEVIGIHRGFRGLLEDQFSHLNLRSVSGIINRGGTILMSTHTLEVAEVMCDRVAIVYRGKVAAQGTLADLRQQTASGDGTLEEMFLKLTGGLREHQLDSVFEV
jgi:6-phosphofructokinase